MEDTYTDVGDEGIDPGEWDPTLFTTMLRDVCEWVPGRGW
jgi:hypothetical protein